MYKITKNGRVVAQINQYACTIDVLQALLNGGWGIEI